MDFENINITEDTMAQQSDVSSELDNGEMTQSQSVDAVGVSENDGECDSADCQGKPFITVRYNHNDVPLSENDAVTFAQKGMAYDSLYSALKRAAALKGVDIKSLIKGFEADAEDDYRRQLIEKYGEESEAVKELMELYRAKRENDVNEFNGRRDAALDVQFAALKNEFPEISAKDDLPQSVLRAFDEGEELLSAYLKYKFFEDKRIKAAEKNAAAASAAAAGRLSSDAVVESAADAFIKGVRG